MKLVDVNLLLHATNPLIPEHTRAAAWFDDAMNSGERIGMAWATLTAFLRLSTRRLPFREPLTMDAALEYVEDWLEWDTVWVPQPTDNHAKVLIGLLRRVPKSDMVSDAHLAALALEHNLTICTADAGFKLFPGVRVLNPLE